STLARHSLQSTAATSVTVTTASGSASCTVLTTLAVSNSGGKCVTSESPSSCTPCEPAANSALITASRSAHRSTRTARHSLLTLRAIPNLGPESALAPRWRNGTDFVQATEQRGLFVVHHIRSPELQPHVQIACARCIDARKPAAAQVHYLPALRSGRNPQSDRRRDRGNLDVRAERKLRIRDENLGEQILSVALEALVLIDL